ncbi:MAG: hypothetical protein ACPGYV_13740, partial [Phycisphaeraceae bacterium]
MSTATPHAHDHSHAHDHHHVPGTNCCEVSGLSPTASDGEQKLDLQIIAVLLGATVLIAAAVARVVFETTFHSDVLAAIASILVGGPIVYGAAKGLVTGRCSHDHGPGQLHDHDGHEHVA